MLDVLIFIYQNYWDKQAAKKVRVTDEAIMAHELSQAGFKHQDILRAFDWVKELRQSVQQQPHYLADAQAWRMFCDMERQKIGEESLNFLQMLQKSELISAYERDLIIDRALLLPQETLALSDIRWITMMVMHDELRKRDYLFVEDAIFNLHNSSLQ